MASKMIIFCLAFYNDNFSIPDLSPTLSLFLLNDSALSAVFVLLYTHKAALQAPFISVF